MDLRDSTKEQVAAHIEWLRERFVGDSPPSPAVWEELCREANERALFTEAFILPKVDEPTAHLPSLHVIRGTGAGEALVHPRERMRVYGVDEPVQNGASEPEPAVP